MRRQCLSFTVRSPYFSHGFRSPSEIKRGSFFAVRRLWPSFVVCRFDLILQSGNLYGRASGALFSGNAVSSGEGEGERGVRKKLCLQPDRRNFFLHEDDKYYIWCRWCFYISGKIRKDITVPLFLSCLAAGAVQLRFILYTIQSVRKPGFPYYNTIFQSEYYPIENFKDRRWG